MAFVGFEESKEVRRLAESIIDEHHPHLKDAKQQIGFYLREGNSKWAGKAKKCTAFERHMTDYMLFVFINKDAWKTMPEEQRAALVDHELCHFTREEWEEPDPKDQSKWVTVYGAATDPDSWESASMTLRNSLRLSSAMVYGIPVLKHLPRQSVKQSIK